MSDAIIKPLCLLWHHHAEIKILTFILIKLFWCKCVWDLILFYLILWCVSNRESLTRSKAPSLPCGTPSSWWTSTTSSERWMRWAKRWSSSVCCLFAVVVESLSLNFLLLLLLLCSDSLWGSVESSTRWGVGQDDHAGALWKNLLDQVMLGNYDYDFRLLSNVI